MDTEQQKEIKILQGSEHNLFFLEKIKMMRLKLGMGFNIYLK